MASRSQSPAQTPQVLQREVFQDNLRNPQSLELPFLLRQVSRAADGEIVQKLVPGYRLLVETHDFHDLVRKAGEQVVQIGGQRLPGWRVRQPGSQRQGLANPFPSLL